LDAAPLCAGGLGAAAEAGAGVNARVWAVWRKDLALGPRSPLLLYVLALPLLVTLVVQGVFGQLGAAPPRLGVVAPEGGAAMLAALAEAGVRVTLVADERVLLERVERHALTAGLLLPAGFERALRAGERPPLRLYVAGESLASDRVLVTMAALLASPLSVGELLVAKGLFGGTLALLMGVVTLALQGMWRGDWLLLLPPLIVGAWMAAILGGLYGVWARDTKTLFALFKSLNLVVVAPALFYLFPEWPRGIAYLFPTFWVIDPLVAVALHGAGLVEVAGSLAVAVGWCLALTLGLARWSVRLLLPPGS